MTIRRSTAKNIFLDTVFLAGYRPAMDWTLAIQRNRDALLSIVASIIALVGQGDGPIARHLRSAALALLRPAEAAARRLIVIAARGLVVALRSSRPPILAIGATAGSGCGRAPAFTLFERPNRYAPILLRPEPKGVPRIRTFWTTAANQPSMQRAAPPINAGPDPQALVSIARLRLRLAALEAALEEGEGGRAAAA
jgi:hypothetical protein